MEFNQDETHADRFARCSQRCRCPGVAATAAKAPVKAAKVQKADAKAAKKAAKAKK